MAFQLSPGVNVTEIDLTTVVPSVSTTTGAFAGYLPWGPAQKIITLPDEKVVQQQYDEFYPKITALRAKGMSIQAISKELGITIIGDYINTDTKIEFSCKHGTRRAFPWQIIVHPHISE